jgi:hypothetical protein
MQSFRRQAGEQNTMPAVHPNGESFVLFRQTVPFLARESYTSQSKTKSPAI